MPINNDNNIPPKYLVLGKVLLSILLFHSKLVVHLLSSFTDVFSLAQLVYMCQTFSVLPFRFYKDVFDLWIGLEIKTKGKAMNNTEILLCWIKMGRLSS